MKTSYTLIAIFFLLSTTSLCQTNPPPMAAPADTNKILIDKIIEITSHEKYFIEYCASKVRKCAEKNYWTANKTNEILESIKFDYYNPTIYNSYAFYSNDQLKKILSALTIINQKPKNNLTMIFTNSMMQNNLDLFIENLLEGKYVAKHK
jgi:superfamily II RNA helicase